MKASTFNFLVAIWCAGAAAFTAHNGADSFIVGLNAMLALLNLSVGLMMHKSENAKIIVRK